MKPIKKTLSPFTVASPKMVNKVTEFTQATTSESSIMLQTLREELQVSREAVLRLQHLLMISKQTFPTCVCK